MVSGTCASRMRRPSVAVVVVERREQLLDVERDAVRALVHGLDDVARGGQVAAEDQRRGHAGLVERQGAELDLLGVALAEQPRPPLAMDRVDRELVGAVVAQDEQRPVRRVPGELADHLEADLVRPVQVHEDEQGRPIDRLEDPVGGRAHDQPARPEGVAVVAAVDRQEIVGQAAERLVAAHPGRHLADRSERHLVVLRRDRAAGDAKARPPRLPDGRPHQPRLPEPRLARQEEGVAVALGCLGEQLVEPARGDRRARRGSGHRTVPSASCSAECSSPSAGLSSVERPRDGRAGLPGQSSRVVAIVTSRTSACPAPTPGRG